MMCHMVIVKAMHEQIHAVYIVKDRKEEYRIQIQYLS